MKKSLLMVAAAAALVFPVQAEVTYQLLYRGKNSAGEDPKFSEKKGVAFTPDGKGGYTVTVPEINTTTGGFKIVSDDEDVKNKVKEELNLASPGIWHTQFGAAPKSSGVVGLSEEDEPLLLTDFYTEVKTTGHAPGEIQFAGGVRKATDVTVYFWPAEKLIKVTGTPVEWANFGITDASIGWVAPTAANGHLFTHEGNGIYSGTYDFGEEDGEKKFKIRPSNNTKPTYGFAKDGSNQTFGPGEITRSGDNLKQTLTGFHIDTEKRRAPGDASVAASINVTLPTTVKANLKGKYNVRFDSNSGELSLESASDLETSVEEISGIESFSQAEYYNMQGVRIDKPERGIYIVLQGGKSKKVIVR